MLLKWSILLLGILFMLYLFHGTHFLVLGVILITICMLTLHPCVLYLAENI